MSLIPAGFADRNICIIGLGYVGLTLAVAMADLGFKVHGVEKREDVVADLKRGEPHFWEPRLREKMERVMRKGALTMSGDFAGATNATVYIITVGTPLGKDGKAQLGMVRSVSEQVAANAPKGSLVILRSTVALGTARNIVKPILDAANKGLQIAMCPERTLEGRALIELHELPQVIGADQADTRTRCMQLFNLVTRTTVAVRSLETAELVKLIDNTYRDVTFAFANEVAELCSHLGVSATEVIRSGKLGYPRTNVPLPGPVGGPCLEKDPHILCESAAALGVDMPITRASRGVNEAQPKRAAAHIRTWSSVRSGFPKAPRISLLGLAFKGFPATDDLRGTMALPIYRALQDTFPEAHFVAWDPVVKPADIASMFNMPVAPSLEDAFADANIAVIMNNHHVFATADLGALTQRMARPGLVYDFWNMFEDVEETLPEHVDCLALGSENARAWA